MRKNYEEPLYIDKKAVISPDEKSQDEIKKILLSEPFAVLSTQGEGQPFSSLISYACSDDFKRIIFATPLATRKFDLISRCSKVSILIDTRSTNPESINDINAITVVGDAKIIKDIQNNASYETLLLKAHPYLETFIKATTTCIIAVDVDTYIYVRKFQEVIEWNPS